MFNLCCSFRAETQSSFW